MNDKVTTIQLSPKELSREKPATEPTDAQTKLVLATGAVELAKMVGDIARIEREVNLVERQKAAEIARLEAQAKVEIELLVQERAAMKTRGEIIVTIIHAVGDLLEKEEDRANRGRAIDTLVRLVEKAMEA